MNVDEGEDSTVYKRVCPQCGSVNIEMIAIAPTGTCQQWRCPDCGYEMDGAPAASEVFDENNRE